MLYHTLPFSKSCISLPPALNGQRRFVSVKIEQLLFVCPAGSTV